MRLLYLEGSFCEMRGGDGVAQRIEHVIFHVGLVVGKKIDVILEDIEYECVEYSSK